MVDLLVRIVGSIAIGLALGAAGAGVVSRTFSGVGGDLLPAVLMPVTVIVVFLASYALVPRPR